MEARRTIQVRATASIAWDEPECVIIRKHWPGLSGPDKLAWLYLWEASRRGLEEISVTAAMVAADQGTSGDAGLDRLKNLDRAGLLGDEPGKWDKKTGRWLLRMPNPFDVGWRIVRDANGQVQQEFDFLSRLERSQILSEADDRPIAGGIHCERDSRTSEPSPVRPAGDGHRVTSGTSPDPSEDPPPRAPSDTFGEVINTYHLPPSEDLRNPASALAVNISESGAPRTGASSDPGRGTAGASPEARATDYLQRLVERKRGATGPPPPTIADATVAAAVAARTAPDPRAQKRRVEEYVAHIKAAVNCPRLHDAPCVSLAWQVVEGRIAWSKVQEILNKLSALRHAGELRNAPSVFFNKCRDKLYREHELPLPKEVAAQRREAQREC